MSAATLAPNVPLNDFQAAQDQAAQAMSLLSTDTDIATEDLRTLQDFYDELEQRRALLGQDLDYSLDDSESANDVAAPDPVEIEKAVQFAKFLKSLDGSDEATKVLVQGSSHVVAALGLVEKETELFENAPMEDILGMYERIKAREESLRAGGAPVSLVNARVYLSEAMALLDTVQMLVNTKEATVGGISVGGVEVGTSIEATG
ncbi:hypothetical protein B0H14DRAFT_2843867 [Mycena olivaceomarginata]|nr:hypothetical protein B0H14DRAFT_2843867 [Mycena olivaceomarginata]